MEKVYFRIFSVLSALTMLICIIGACQKPAGDANQSPSSSKQVSQSANASKTSAKAATPANITSAAVRTTVSASAAAAAPSNTAVAADNAEADSSPADAGNEGKEGADEASGSGSTPAAGKSIAGSVTNLGEQGFDLGGATIIFATNSTAVTPTNDPKHGNYIWYKRLEALEQKYNFKMEYKTAASAVHYAEILNQTMAGLRYADVVSSQASYTFPLYVSKGIVLPWDEYVDYDTPILKVNSYMCKGTYWNGKHYGTSRGIYQAAYPDLMYNRGITEREGQQDILDLVESNQWTWQNMLNIAVNCTKDLNGDGIVDQWGIACPTVTSYAVNTLHSNGIKFIEFVDNEPQLSVLSPAARRALQFMSDLSFVHKVYITDKNVYKAGLAAIYMGTGWAENIAHLQAGINSIVAPLPMGPDVSSYQSLYTTSQLVMLATCPKPRETAIIMMESNIVWDENLKPIPEVTALAAVLPYDWWWNPKENPQSRMSSERENKVVEALYPLFDIDYSYGYTSPSLSGAMGRLIYTPVITGAMSVNQALAAAEWELQSIVNQYK